MARLLSLGIQVEADRAERARDRRDPTEAERSAAVARSWLRQARALVRPAGGDSWRPLLDTAAEAGTAEAEFTRLEGRSDPDRWLAAAARWEALGQPYRAAYATGRAAEALAGDPGRRVEPRSCCGRRPRPPSG